MEKENLHFEEDLKKDQVSKQEKEKKTEDQKTTRKIHHSMQKAVMVAAILSLLIGSLAGSVFGFLASQFSTKGLAGILNGFGGANSQKILQDKTAAKKDANTSGKIDGVSQQDMVQEDAAVTGVVEKDSPAVVSIIITKDVPKIESLVPNPFFNDPFFDPFGFQNRQQQPQPTQPQTEKKEIGGGTGFIVDPSGYIVTNKHVVKDSQAQYTVMMNDGKKIEAKVLALDPYNDLAIIKIDAKNLPTVALGDSDNLKIGQTVIAIGNSLGEFRNTVSKGIISGLKRNVSAGDGGGQSEVLEQVIQTDAAINPGNSGGPLLNLKGEVVGVNVAMAQGAENIGFSVPVNLIKKNLESVKTTGKISRPYVGVRFVMLNAQIQQENGLPVDYGCLVIRGNKPTDLAIIPGSPADKAGIMENDIILEVDGLKLKDSQDLSKAIRDKNVGDEISLKVLSKGAEKTVRLKLEELPSR